MSPARAILLIVILSSLSMFGILAGIHYLYEEKPEYLGLKPRIPTVIVTTATLTVDTTAIRLVNERQEKKKIVAQRDSLANVLFGVKDSITKMKSLSDSLRLVATNLQKELEAERAKRFAQGDSLTKEDFQTFAKIYNSTNPQVVARVLENIDVREAATILKAMSKRSAAKVIEALPPDQAASILTMGSLPATY